MKALIRRERLPKGADETTMSTKCGNGNVAPEGSGDIDEVPVISPDAAPHVKDTDVQWNRHPYPPFSHLWFSTTGGAPRPP